jgi:hypothetical protein
LTTETTVHVPTIFCFNVSAEALLAAETSIALPMSVGSITLYIAFMASSL